MNNVLYASRADLSTLEKIETSLECLGLGLKSMNFKQKVFVSSKSVASERRVYFKAEIV